ncbi:hypothetical protein [Maribellus sediminis]|uniref:hypothetical protein n=1 Tax=Maribellus sediminis TaxID=2696285 RepID=UPI00143218A7|nr:hypothetical protein [Maribellus sediminis]
MKNFEINYILADGRTAATLKEVRQKLGCSGRAIRHLIEDGTIKKVELNLNVENDGTANNN